MAVSLSKPVIMSKTVTRDWFRVEGTGGGCEALVRTLSDGSTLVITDGNLGVDLGALVDVDCNLGVYPVGAWGDGGDSLPEYDREAQTEREIMRHAAKIIAQVDGVDVR